VRIPPHVAGHQSDRRPQQLRHRQAVGARRADRSTAPGERGCRRSVADKCRHARPARLWLGSRTGMRGGDGCQHDVPCRIAHDVHGHLDRGRAQKGDMAWTGPWTGRSAWSHVATSSFLLQLLPWSHGAQRMLYPRSTSIRMAPGRVHTEVRGPRSGMPRPGLSSIRDAG
jgi:hypothetical protein